MRGSCASKNTIPRGPNRTKPFPTKACTSTLAPYLSRLGHRSLKPRLHQKPRANNQLQPRLIPSQDVVFSSQIIEFISLSLAAFIAHSAFAFCLSLGFLGSSFTQVSVVTVQLFPLTSFNSFENCLAETVPICIHQGRSQKFSNVIHINARFSACQILPLSVSNHPLLLIGLPNCLHSFSASRL